MKLPKEILHEIAIYYAARELKKCYGNPKWNKDKCLNNLDKACRKHGVSFEACAGTFWFYFKGKKNQYKMDESTFPEIEKVSN